MENCLRKIWPTYARRELHDSILVALFTEIEVTLWYFRVEKVLVIPSQQLAFFPNVLIIFQMFLRKNRFQNSSHFQAIGYACATNSKYSKFCLIN